MECYACDQEAIQRCSRCSGRAGVLRRLPGPRQRHAIGRSLSRIAGWVVRRERPGAVAPYPAAVLTRRVVRGYSTAADDLAASTADRVIAPPVSGRVARGYAPA